MPLNNLKDHLKTSPTTAPPSMSGVRHQLRFWGMGSATGNARQVPELQSKMGRYALSSAQHMSQLQKRAAELQLGVQQADSIVKAGAMEDQSNLNHQQLEIQQDAAEEDLLGQASRAVAGTVAVGQALRVTTSALGMESITAFLDKIPLVGKTKELRKVEELEAEMMEAYRQQDFKRAESYAKTVELIGDATKTMNSLRGKLEKWFTPEVIDSMLPDAGLTQEFDRISTEYRDYMLDYLHINVPGRPQ